MASSTDLKDDRQTLEILLKRTQDTHGSSLLPDELSYLITAFLPSHPPTIRSKAYLILSAFCQGARNASSVRGKQPDPNTATLAKTFGPPVLSRLADTEEQTLLAGVSFLTALFQVDWESASSIFQQDGVLESIMDSVDLNPSAQLSGSVAHLLAQACGHKPCRAILTSQSIQWLENMSHTSMDMIPRAGALNALIKLSKGTAVDNSEARGLDARIEERKDAYFADGMKAMIMAGGEMTSIADAIEGLAYLSVDPAIKEALSNDSVFLQRLFALISRRKASADPTSTLAFGILVIISNMCAYRPRLTEEQTQIEKLRRMAKAGKGSMEESPTSIFDDDENVRARVRRLVAAGALGIFSAAVPGTDSPRVRITAGKALLSIIEDKENRGKVLQSGGAKVLALIIKHATSNVSEPDKQAPLLETGYLESIQALSKLAITSSPVQVFGPNEGAMYDAIRPLSIMLQHPSSTLLQRFEAMMALTNLASQSAETSFRIAQAEGLINKVESLLLEDHPLVRRAAMELLCNLVAGSDYVFERYSGGDNPSGAKSKLQVVLALSDVEDLPTRLAASGALATLTAAPGACKSLVALQYERHRVLSILAQLIHPSGDGAENDSHPGLVHRAVICTRNICHSIDDPGSRKKLAEEAEEAGLLKALMSVVKGQVEAPDEFVMRPAVEALKVLTVDKKI